MTARRFRPGQVVRCVDNDGSDLLRNAMYVVEQSQRNDATHTIRVLGSTRTWNVGRFVFPESPHQSAVSLNPANIMVGDLVQCVSPRGFNHERTDLELGQQYRVTDTSDGLTVVDDAGRTFTRRYPTRFIRVAANEPIHTGDYVRCHNTTNATDRLQVGHVHQVRRVTDYVYLGSEAFEHNEGFYPHRFERIVVPIPQPQPKPTNQSKEHTMQQTFTADEIRDAVMDYRQGCREGKIEFLKEAFDIDIEPEIEEFTISVTLALPARDIYDAANSQVMVRDAVIAVLREESSTESILNDLDSSTEYAVENWQVS